MVVVVVGRLVVGWWERREVSGERENGVEEGSDRSSSSIDWKKKKKPMQSIPKLTCGVRKPSSRFRL